MQGEKGITLLQYYTSVCTKYSLAYDITVSFLCVKSDKRGKNLASSTCESIHECRLKSHCQATNDESKTHDSITKLVSMNVLGSQIAFDCPRTPSTLKDLEITSHKTFSTYVTAD